MLLGLLAAACADMCTSAGYSTASVAWPAHEYRNAENALDMTCRLYRIQCAETDRPNAQWRSNGSPLRLIPKQHLWRPASALACLRQQALQQDKSQPSMMKEPPLLWAFLELVSNTSHKWCRSRTCQQYRYLSLFYQKRSK